MANQQKFEIYGHPSIYKPEERKLQIYFSEPDNGINEKTGILLLIPGFGGNANSNIYKKMRNCFADEYNLIVVQCDYFGWEFMQAPNNVSINLSKKELSRMFTNRELDNISAIVTVIEVIKDNGYKFDESKIIIYGHSHGAYLAYLCNAFAPNLFSAIIDNSAWLFPVYLHSNRYVNQVYDRTILSVQFEYLAKSMSFDEEILSLPSLYKKFENNCNIVCYHGVNDNLVSIDDKAKFAQNISKLLLNKIDSHKVDGEIFRSTQHGLEADFIKMFEFAMQSNVKYKEEKKFSLDDVKYETSKGKYYFDYSNTVPKLTIR